MSYATKEQLEELASYMASQINVPTIGIGGGYAPIGTIISYMGTTAPQDYLACDGSTKNIADYPQLADFFEAQFGSKNYFGGDGVTTFAVPDLQGEFLRGTGTNSHAGQGSGANVGVHQNGTRHSNVFGSPDRIYTERSNIAGDVDAWSGALATCYGVNNGTAGGTKQYPFYVSRPTNTSVLYCIKAVVAGDVYSTEERVVGTWIDGKPLYQKTYTGTCSQIETIIENKPEVDNIVDCNITLRAYDGYQAGNRCWEPRGSRVVVIDWDFDPSKNLHLLLGDYYVGHTNTYYMTVQYTKTTD